MSRLNAVLGVALTCVGHDMLRRATIGAGKTLWD